MGRILFLLFTVVPLVELYLLLLLGQHFSPWASVGLVLATGLLGATLARREGWRVMGRWRESLARGQMPEEGLLSGVLVLVGGVLLVTPGVLTDVAGLLLLLPPTRRWVAARVRRRLEQRMATGSLYVTTFQTGGPSSGVSQGRPFREPPSRRPERVDDAEWH